ncbi:hypothetical protein EOA25_28630 [Mesorhizobium sp. M2A.F.Ca.ET.040.01.1.1]|nr:hypothetical protein EOA25_28630 [Mesorhizobium sp. M2A.F.Ca.ET.040.01.1.1]
MARRATIRSLERVPIQRTDGRRSLLVYLDPVVIKALKKAAVDDDRHSYEIAEEAIRDWLRERELRVSALG